MICELLTETYDDLAEYGARKLVFMHWTGDWRQPANNPDVDKVNISSP